ncbi:MAG: hypothetical protein ACM3VS_11390 [Candidatus Dadabacteria bacterium]
MDKVAVVLKFATLHDLLEYLNIVPVVVKDVDLIKLIIATQLSDREIELAKNGFNAQIVHATSE